MSRRVQNRAKARSLGEKNKKKCEICKLDNHSTAECRLNPSNRLFCRERLEIFLQNKEQGEGKGSEKGKGKGKPTGICWNHQAGYCWRGSECRFRHVEDKKEE